MIDEDNKEELELMAAIVKNIHSIAVDDLVFEGVNEAIYTSTDIDSAIKYIIANHPTLFKILTKIVKNNYPDKLHILEKLGVLI